MVAAICEHEDKDEMGFTIEAMKRLLEALGYEIVGELAVLRIFDKAKIKQDQDAIDRTTELGMKLAASIRE